MRRESRSVGRWAATVALASVALVFVFPFAWMFLATFKANPEIFRPFPLLPGRFHLDHYRALLDGSVLPFARHLANSLVVASAQTVLVLALTVPAGYVFALHPFRGRRALYGLALGTVVVSPQALALPLFAWMHWLGLYDTLWAVILPGVASGLGLVFFTLVFRRLPPELLPWPVARAPRKRACSGRSSPWCARRCSPTPSSTSCSPGTSTSCRW